MVKLFTQEVRACGQCPNLKPGYTESGYRCEAAGDCGDPIQARNNPPHWCPLPGVPGTPQEFREHQTSISELFATWVEYARNFLGRR
jgi:hypothetical protein